MLNKSQIVLSNLRTVIHTVLKRVRIFLWDPVYIEWSLYRLSFLRLPKSKAMQFLIVAIGTFLTIYTFVVLVLPTLLRSQRQLLSLREYGYFYDERSLETDVISIIITAVTVIGIFSIVCTEACLSVYSSYLCGLIEIARYYYCVYNILYKVISLTISGYNMIFQLPNGLGNSTFGKNTFSTNKCATGSGFAEKSFFVRIFIWISQ